MKLAMAQITLYDDMDKNLEKAISFIKQAQECDLIFFPEIQLSPFFPQYEKYDASLWITPDGKIADIAKMVHIMQAERFYEQDHYTPSEDGFKVFDTPFGKVGIVICFDRHLPESIRTCTLKGAQLIIIPTANTLAEPLEMFEWELRVQAFQNNVFVAMCNRVGREDKMYFCGQSLIVSPDGDILFKANGSEQLITADLDLSLAAISRCKRPYITTRRNDGYYRK